MTITDAILHGPIGSQATITESSAILPHAACTGPVAIPVCPRCGLVSFDADEEHGCRGTDESAREVASTLARMRGGER